MTKTVTKKQLLAAACTSEQKKVIKRYWPSGEQTVPIIRVVRMARGMRIESKLIEILIANLDPKGWMKATQDIVAHDARILHYLRREEEIEQTQPEFVPKYWWDQPFAKRMIERGINPTYPFAPPWYPRHVSERDWSLTGNLEDELKAKEKTVTKTFTKKQLLDVICDDRYRRVVENYWPFGKSELAIREIVAIARRLQDVSIYAVSDRQIVDLIHVLDRDGLAESAGGIDVITTPFKDRQPTRLVNMYLAWDEKRRLERTYVVDSRSGPVRVHEAYERIAPTPKWTPTTPTYREVLEVMAELREAKQSRRADMTLKETVALLKKVKGKSSLVPSLHLYRNGRGSLRDLGRQDKVVFEFHSVEELEEKLKELIAKGE